MIGLIAIFNWKIALITFGIAFIGFAATRYISAGSLGIALLFPVMTVILKYPPEASAVAVVICAICWYMHRENIKRILNKSERKFSLSSKKEA
jgi:glycerol-3-phosphate acyltransferase PlsY